MIHHHSFAYINRLSPITRLALAAAGSACHVVLCDGMAEAFMRAYGIDGANIFILSNAAFIDPPAAAFHDKARKSSALQVGYLSSVSSEKGIFTFLDVIARAETRGLPLDARIAGPIAVADRARFEAVLATTSRASYVGPVYGEDKQLFLENLDILLFPTAYVNEAEPVTIIEALSYGVPVVANARGCIGSMIPAAAGRIVDRPEEFVQEAIATLLALSGDRELLQAQSRVARAAFERSRELHAGQLAALIDLIWKKAS